MIGIGLFHRAPVSRKTPQKSWKVVMIKSAPWMDIWKEIGDTLFPGFFPFSPIVSFQAPNTRTNDHAHGYCPARDHSLRVMVSDFSAQYTPQRNGLLSNAFPFVIELLTITKTKSLVNWKNKGVHLLTSKKIQENANAQRSVQCVLR